VGHDNVFELVLKGFGPGRNAALPTILGPHGDTIRAKSNRIIDAMRIAVGLMKITNKRKR